MPTSSITKKARHPGTAPLANQESVNTRVQPELEAQANVAWGLTVEADELLRLPAVLKLLKISRSAWYLGIKRNYYPSPVRISQRSVAWRRSDILKLIRDGIPSSNANAK